MITSVGIPEVGSFVVFNNVEGVSIVVYDGLETGAKVNENFLPPQHVYPYAEFGFFSANLVHRTSLMYTFFFFHLISVGLVEFQLTFVDMSSILSGLK